MDIGDYEWLDKKHHCPVIDWRQADQMNPKLKNQKKCGSCWAHSTVAAVENLYARHNVLYGDDIPSLSEQ